MTWWMSFLSCTSRCWKFWIPACKALGNLLGIGSDQIFQSLCSREQMKLAKHMWYSSVSSFWMYDLWDGLYINLFLCIEGLEQSISDDGDTDDDADWSVTTSIMSDFRNVGQMIIWCTKLRAKLTVSIYVEWGKMFNTNAQQIHDVPFMHASASLWKVISQQLVRITFPYWIYTCQYLYIMLFFPWWHLSRDSQAENYHSSCW